MFKKVLVYLILITVLVGSVTVFAQNYVPYQNPSKGFSIQVPAGWQQMSQNIYGQDVIYFLSLK